VPPASAPLSLHDALPIWRLILADAVAYAESLGARTIIDVATLTGACVIALGHVYAGLIANDDALSADIVAAGRRAGERFWPLPRSEEHTSELHSREKLAC